jgi:hypothetical protein
MLTITLLSLVVAAASGLFAWRSIRREHLRSNARVASLALAIDENSRPSYGGDSAPAFDEYSYSLDFRSEMDATSLDALGAHPTLRRRLMTMVSGASVVVAGVVLIAMTSDRYDQPTQPVVSPHAESLELLSLQAARDGSTLAVSGLVRSRAEEPLTTVTAVVSAIDAKGRPVGRGTVPLAAILPRRESRFVVTITDAGEAARYRVSFRSATGVIRHVDRRAERTSEVS